jgi:hypothetical protein
LVLVTDADLVLEKLPTPDVKDVSHETIAPGCHLVKITITSAVRPNSTPYTAFYNMLVPEANGGNSQFYLRHQDDLPREHAA